MMGMSSPGNSYCEELAELHLDELDELGVVDHVRLVEVDDHAGDADLAGKEYVLTGLGQRGRRYPTTRMAPSIWAAPVISVFLM